MKGLNSQEDAKRLQEYGQNTITDTHKRTIFMIFFEQFKSLLILLLLASSIFSFIVGEHIDGALILAIVILNAMFGVYQEQKAENAISALKEMTISLVRVIRDGTEQEIDSTTIVPGDLVRVEEGVKIPADARVIEAVNLELNEASLTGESVPVVKAVEDGVFAGTIVVKGRGYAEVIATGMNTKFGQIAAGLSSVSEGKTPLQKKLATLTKIIGVAALVLSAFLFMILRMEGATLIRSILLPVSLIVALIPEGLPAVMTATFAIGMRDMAKKKAILRKLSAIEALGSVTLIATDKTGTLTENSMNVKELWFDNGFMQAKDNLNTKIKSLELIIKNGILCSTASLVHANDTNSFRVLGDPTEGALLLFAHSKGVNPEEVKNQAKILHEIPFDSITKRMTVTVQQNDLIQTFTKGAPESVMAVCPHIMIDGKKVAFTKERKEEIQKIMTGWSQKGLRILAFSYQEHQLSYVEKINSHTQTKKHDDEAFFQEHLQDQIFLGMTAIHDPPRMEAKEAIKKAHSAGIQVVMITGDNPVTAEAIGKEVGLLEGEYMVLTGDQVEAYSDEQLLKILPQVKVFARITPFHKSRIVNLYQRSGEVVAVTGDGVNDAIALKQADVGIAMGLVGTDVARETADMVITDDNFATIINAVEEGRNIIRNVRSAIVYLFTTNIIEATVLVGGVLLGFPELFSPIQLLYINLISDGVPALSLAFTPKNEHIMSQKPERQMSIFTPIYRMYVPFIALLGTAGIFCSFLYFGDHYPEYQSVAAFSLLALIQPFILLDLWISHKPLLKSLHLLPSKIFLFAFAFSFVAQIIIMRTPAIASVFHIPVVPWSLIFWMLGLSLTFMVLLELFKVVYRIVHPHHFTPHTPVAKA